MKSVGSITLGTAFVCLGLVVALAGQQPAPKAPASTQGATAAKPGSVPATSAKPVVSHASAKPAQAVVASAEEQNALVKRYCAGCHSDRNKERAGNLSLQAFDFAKVGHESDVAERMIRKLQAGMMPPPGMPRPEPAVYQKFITSLETTVDADAKANPNPGGRTFQRLNRPEYTRAVKELLDLDVDAGRWLPLDTMSANFDNIADEQTLSPTLLESYLNAAADISRMAVGDKDAPSIDSHLHQPELRVAAPVGSRRGRAVRHARRHGGGARVPGRRRVRLRDDVQLGGDNTRFEDIDISIDGERVALVEYETDQHRAAPTAAARCRCAPSRS